MKHTPPASSPWALKSQQEIIDFLSAYAERQQPLPTTFKGYLDLLTDNSDEPAIQYLRKSQLGALDAIWRVIFLLFAPTFLSLPFIFFLPAGALGLMFLSFCLSLAIAFGPVIYSRWQLSQVYYADTTRITNDFKNLLKPLIKTYNSSLKGGFLAHQDIKPLVAGISSFQEIHPLVPVISRLDRGPVPWDVSQGLELEPVPWSAPQNPYKPYFVDTVLRDDWSPGMRHMFSPDQLLYDFASALDDLFFLPAPRKLLIAFSIGTLFAFLNLTVRFGAIHLYYVGQSSIIGLLVVFLFYATLLKNVSYLMTYAVHYYGPNGNPQSITFWNLYKAFRREVLPSVKAAYKGLITPADLERVYASFRARYPLIDPEFPGQE